MNETENLSRPQGSSLEISQEEMHELSSGVTRLVTDYFFRSVQPARVFPKSQAAMTTQRLGASLPLAGEPLDQLLGDCRAILEG